MYITTNFLKENRSKNNKLDVKQLQALLNFLGESLIVDGDFGAKSTIAVKNFQKLQSIQTDGKVGEQTWLKFYEASLTHVQKLIDEQNDYEELSADSDNRELILWLQSILYLIDNKTQTTAKFDEALGEIVIGFQSTSECTENGCVDTEMWQKLFERTKEVILGVYGRLLNDDDIIKIALENDLSPAAVKAVLKVESRGRGFMKDGKLLILFEGHKFYAQLKIFGLNPNDYTEGNEDIIFAKYNKNSYNGNQHARLDRAVAIHKEAALKSASYGLFQIMGFNYKHAGFKSVGEYVETMKINEIKHLEAFMSFIKATNCFKYLQDKDWTKFARAYNGSAYKENRYDEKMEKQYNSSNLTKGIGETMDEETYTNHYALELEKAFYEFED